MFNQKLFDQLLAKGVAPDVACAAATTPDAETPATPVQPATPTQSTAKDNDEGLFSRLSSSASVAFNNAVENSDISSNVDRIGTGIIAGAEVAVTKVMKKDFSAPIALALGGLALKAVGLETAGDYAMKGAGIVAGVKVAGAIKDGHKQYKEAVTNENFAAQYRGGKIKLA